MVFSKLGFFSQAKEEGDYPSTQEQLPFEYIRSGVVKLKSGGYRMVVSLPSINIDLKEGSEKHTILLQYREILNAIDFPIQYLQQSRTVDISDYLAMIRQKQAEAQNIFVQNQLGFYADYLVNLIKNRSVLTKKFYCVVTFDEKKDLKNLKTKVQPKKKKKGEEEEENDVYIEEQKFERARSQLWIRAKTIEKMFRRYDIAPKILNDEELLELFYTSYNKNRANYQPLRGKDPADFMTIRVKAEEGGYHE